jgi:hypothetical protein
MAIPERVKINPERRLSCFGKIFVPISMKREMIKIFERVPNPGRSFNGIHKERTSAPIMRVDVPIDNPLLSEIP